jgi:hypothetical protein
MAKNRARMCIACRSARETSEFKETRTRLDRLENRHKIDLLRPTLRQGEPAPDKTGPSKDDGKKDKDDDGPPMLKRTN